MNDFDGLTRETQIRQVEFHESIESTNDRALELCKALDLSTPLLVIAREQTRGRGRGSNSWWSTSGSLTFSIIWTPDAIRCPITRWPQISLVTGLAVHDALSSLARNATLQLKWPNDVYLEGKKVCGILVEVPQLATPRIVVGIGINVNNTFRLAPSDISRTAISLTDFLQTELPIRTVLTRVINCWFERLDAWISQSLSLREAWGNCCLLQGRLVGVQSGGTSISGLCLGIDQEGALLIDSETGHHRLFSGVVQFWS